jgi:hypothetical protein
MVWSFGTSQRELLRHGLDAARGSKHGAVWGLEVASEFAPWTGGFGGVWNINCGYGGNEACLVAGDMFGMRASVALKWWVCGLIALDILF